MKNISYYIIIIALSLSTVEAQNNGFTREVQVERDYNPVVGEAEKLPNVPQIQPITQEKRDAAYSSWTTIAQVDVPNHNLPPAEVAPASYSRGDRFIRLGAGNYTSFLGDLFIPILNRPNTRWSLEANHLSTSGKVTLDNGLKVKAKDNDNRIKTAFTQRFEQFMLDADATFGYRAFNYYGANSFVSEPLPELTNAFTTGGLHAGIRSLSQGSTDFNATLGYDIFKFKEGATEHHIALQGGFFKRMNENGFGIDVALNNFFYNSESIHFKNYAVLKLNPYYAYSGGNLALRLGFAANISGDGEYPLGLMPDLRLTYDLVDSRLQLLASLTGDYKLNSFGTIARENPYISPVERVNDTYAPLDFRAGAKGKITDNLVLGAHAGYKQIMNPYFYVGIDPAYYYYYFDNHNEYVFATSYNESWLFYTGISLEANWTNRFNTLLAWEYNHWETEGAWYKPEHEFRLTGNYKITDKINLSANGYVATGRKKRYQPIPNWYDLYGSIVLDPILDFSLGGTYQISEPLTAFVQLNNLFANKYQLWYGYNAHRFNAMAGITYSF